MAGLDIPNNGDALIQPGATGGIRQQEPQLDETKTVRENVEDGVAIKAKLNRYNEVAELMATDYSDELMDEMGHLQEELDAADAWDIDSQLEQAMDALRCPPPDEPVNHLSGGERRRVALCKLLLSKPDLLLLDSRRRLDAESVRLARTAPRRVQGRDPTVTTTATSGQRGGMDSRARPRPRCRGQYSTYLEKKAERVAVQAGTPSCRNAYRRSSPGCARRQARQARARRGWAAEEMAAEAEKTRKLREIQIPVGPRLGSASSTSTSTKAEDAP
jgi:ATPase subunit of ABC transporter with duplicated ATPase domains